MMLLEKLERLEKEKEQAGIRYQMKCIAETLLNEPYRPYIEEAEKSLKKLLDGDWSILDIENVQLCYGVKFNVYYEKFCS